MGSAEDEKRDVDVELVPVYGDEDRTEISLDVSSSLIVRKVLTVAATDLLPVQLQFLAVLQHIWSEKLRVRSFWVSFVDIEGLRF